MANPNPSYKFPPGVSGNPNGRPKMLLTKDKVWALIGRLSELTTAEITVIRDNPETKILEATIAAIFLKAKKDADPSRLNFLLERTLGKVAIEAPESEETPVTTENAKEIWNAARAELKVS